MNLLEVDALDLGADVRAIGLELVGKDENREPVRGADAATIWTRVLRAAAGEEPWALDFFSHLDRVSDFCARHEINFRQAAQRSIVIGAPEEPKLQQLLERFQNETFGVRAGGPLPRPDSAVEGELARWGVDAYHKEYPNYFFCAVCGFEDGSLVVLSDRLGASELMRRIEPRLNGLEVEVRMSA